MTTILTSRSSVHLTRDEAIVAEHARIRRDADRPHMVRVHVRTLIRLEGRYPYNRDVEAWDDAVRRATGGY